MAFSVNRRTREVGIRMALGAERRDVLFLIIRNAAALVFTGSGGRPRLRMGRDPHTQIVSLWRERTRPAHRDLRISLLLLVCGLIAAFVPARRAASIDPMQALRTE